MPSPRRRLLGVGFGAEGCGFGRVLRSLYQRLDAQWEVEHLEFASPGAAATNPNWRVHHTRRPGLQMGHLEFAELIAERRPQLVLLVGDLWQVPPYVDALAGSEMLPALVAYCPVDAPLPVQLDRRAMASLGRLDRLVVPTRYGAGQISAALGAMGLDPSALPLQVIPHGVDVGFFHPYPADAARSGRQRAREELFAGRPELADAFIVLNANRNQPRKRLDLTLQGFARFAADKPPDVHLFLHAGIIDVGINLVARACALGVQPRVLRLGDSEGHPVVPDTTLNAIYNACDVGVNTSASEGWGLVPFEHAATGAAQIVPDNSASAELWAGSASLLPDDDATLPAALAAALERLYRDRDFCRAQSGLALRNALRDEWRWDDVSRRFGALFSEVFLDSRRLPCATSGK